MHGKPMSMLGNHHMILLAAKHEQLGHLQRVLAICYACIASCRMFPEKLHRVRKVLRNCRNGTGALNVQLCIMESVGCHISCMTGKSDSSSAILGLSSGQLLSIALNTDSCQTVCDTPSHAIGVDSAPAAAAPGNSPAALAFLTLPSKHAAAVTALELSPGGRLLASLSSSDAVILIWSCNTAPATEWTVLARPVAPGAVCLAWLPSPAESLAHRLLVGSSNGQLEVRLHICPGLD